MILSVVNQKGGVGKTTTAVNVAVCAAQLGQSVLLVDLDPQGNATSGLGLTHPLQPTLYQALIAATEQTVELLRGSDGGQDEEQYQHRQAASVLLPAVIPGSVPNLAVIGTSAELAGAEIDLAENQQRNDLKRILTRLGEAYPLIIIDTPPSLSLLTVNALVAADQLIIPVQCEYYALEGLGHLLRTLELIKRSLNPELRVLGLVRTMLDARLGLSHQVSAELKRHFPHLLFETVIPRNVRLAEAPSYGQPITLYDRRSPGAESYRALTQEILNRLSSASKAHGDAR
jgi:chromosome partitioning protein